MLSFKDDNLGLAFKAEAAAGFTDEFDIEDAKKALVRIVANTNRGKVLHNYYNDIVDSFDLVYVLLNC